MQGFAANLRRIRVLRNTLRTIEPDLIVSFVTR